MTERASVGNLALISLAVVAVLTAACGTSTEQPVPGAEPVPAARPQTTTRPSVPAAGAPVWHYEGEEGPDGINNGHTIQINFSEGDTLAIGGKTYQLVQYHFHAPSEHTIDGRHFPMEMHMVHKAGDDQLAVIGVFIEEGEHNTAFDPVWGNLPKEKGVETHLTEVNVDVDELLPKARTTYRYEGSLTTPPISLSAEQIAQFTAIVKGNNRPVQPLNGRTVVTDKLAERGGR